MQPLDLLVVSLATFYVAYAISSTHGPWHIFEWLRGHLPLGGLTGCIVCLSPWVGLLFYLLLTTPVAWIAWVFGVAGASIFAYRWTGGANV